MSALEHLRYKEYWTPTEAAHVLGRGRQFWRGAFDRGEVRGYRSGRARNLLAASARQYLLEQVEATQAEQQYQLGAASREALARFRERVHEIKLAHGAR